MGWIISHSAGTKKRKKVVIKVIKKKSKADGKTPMSTEPGGGDQGGDHANQPSDQLTPGEAFDRYAQQAAELDRHRLTRQNDHLQESDFANLEKGSAMPDETTLPDATLPATLPDQAPTEHDGQGNPGDEDDNQSKPLSDSDAHADKRHVAGDEDDNQSKPLGDSEAHDDKRHVEAWDSSWENGEPWTWEKWNTYGNWGWSTWSGDYWKGNHYSRGESFDSQRSELTSADWIYKAWNHIDSQDADTPHEDRQSFTLYQICFTYHTRFTTVTPYVFVHFRAAHSHHVSDRKRRKSQTRQRLDIRSRRHGHVNIDVFNIHVDASLIFTPN